MKDSRRAGINIWMAPEKRQALPIPTPRRFPPFGQRRTGRKRSVADASGSIVFFLLFLLPGLAFANKNPSFLVETATGQVQGQIRQLKADGSVEVQGEKLRRLPGKQVMSISRVGSRRPGLPTGEHLILVDGDRIPVSGLHLQSEQLHFQHLDLVGNKARLPLAAVAVIWRGPPDRAADPERSRRRFLKGKRARDVVLLRNGDEVQGVLNALDNRTVVMRSKRKNISIKREQVAAIGLSTDLAESLRPRGLFGRLVLAGDSDQGTPDGARWTVTSAVCKDGKTLEAKTLLGAPLRVPLGRVLSLDFFGGACDWLVDLPVARYSYLPYLDEDWKWSRNANVLGHDLRLGGNTWNLGVGVHGASKLHYKLAGRYQHLAVEVGLDDRDGRRGSVEIRILGDGKDVTPKSARGERTFASGPLHLRVPVKGVQELTLEVKLGGRGNVQDVVNWVNGRLLR